LEHAAGKRHLVQAGLAADALAHGQDHLGDSAMKFRANFVRRRAAPHIFNHFGQQAFEADFATPQSKQIPFVI